MTLRESIRSLEPRARALAPWLALGTLWLLFEIPPIFTPADIDLSRLRPSGELLALLTLGGVSFQFTWGRYVRAALYVAAALLWIIRVDALAFRMILGEEQLLYDQLFMLEHTFTLVSDLWSAPMAAGLIGGLGGLALLAWGTRALLRACLPLLHPSRLRSTARLGFIAWLVAIPASTSAVVGLTKRPLVWWQATSLAENIEASRKTYRSVRRALDEPPYGDVMQVSLEDTPDVLLILVESYGRIMLESKALRPVFDASIAELASMSEAAGLVAVSGFSRAPVTGGRSWIADGSLMMGTQIRYEAVFRHLLAHAQDMNTLPNFFKKQGYRTVLVVPGDRKRPGVPELHNPYGYEEVVHFAKLEYRGHPYGWGVVPDQYSLDFVDERLLATAKAPVFLNFHTVTSHAPWRGVPPLVERYTELQESGQQDLDKWAPSGAKMLLATTERYARRDAGRLDYMGELTRKLASRYARSIHYTLSSVARFLGRRDRDALVIVMGDHQPPLISPHSQSFDVPVHVFAKRAALLDEFRARGFVDGLVPSAVKTAPIDHGGLLTLLARALARCCGGDSPLPTLRRRGIPIVR